MTIVVTGGGSGGHITPVLAVAAELKQLNPAVQVVYIGQQGDGLADIPRANRNVDVVYEVRAGKLRRYHSEGLKQLLDVPTLLKNIRDFFFVFIGIWQSYWLLRRVRPDIIFIKGGFVGVPVGLAAATLKIPFITHDSDALPGLANRIISRWARLHAVALPKEVYDYPSDKTVSVGVPISGEFKAVPLAELKAFRRHLQLPEQGRVVLLTGGGLGAKRLNEAFVECLPVLLQRYPDLHAMLLVGRQHEQAIGELVAEKLSELGQARVTVRGFATDLFHYSGAADVIVTRAGATSIAEFAAQAKACVVIPNPYLTAGHQLKNAQVLADHKAIKVVPESVVEHDPQALMPPLVELLDDPALATELGERLHQVSQPGAAEKLAKLLLEQAQTA